MQKIKRVGLLHALRVVFAHTLQGACNPRSIGGRHTQTLWHPHPLLFTPGCCFFCSYLQLLCRGLPSRPGLGLARLDAALPCPATGGRLSGVRMCDVARSSTVDLGRERSRSFAYRPAKPTTYL